MRSSLTPERAPLSPLKLLKTDLTYSLCRQPASSSTIHPPSQMLNLKSFFIVTSCRIEGWDPPLERVPQPVAVAVAPS